MKNADIKRMPVVGIALLLGIFGCATDTMSAHVPAHCHGPVESFQTYYLEYQDVPGFIFDVIDTSLRGALDRQGLTRVDPADADLRIRSSLQVINHSIPREAGDPFGETVAPNELNRFVTHLTVNVEERSSGRLVWTGSVDRSHAIQGGETFHDERATLMISTTLEEMFVGLTSPCE